MAYHVKDKNDLETKLNEAGNNLVVIDFFATWCGPCQAIAPQIEELVKEHPEVVFLKVDIDECEDLALDFNIKAMPTFYFLKNKARLESFSGANFNLLVEKVLHHK